MGKGIRKTINQRPQRTRRKLIVLGAEGDNKTEILYFSSLERLQSMITATSLFIIKRKQEGKNSNGIHCANV